MRNRRRRIPASGPKPVAFGYHAAYMVRQPQFAKETILTPFEHDYLGVLGKRRVRAAADGPPADRPSENAFFMSAMKKLPWDNVLDSDTLKKSL